VKYGSNRRHVPSYFVPSKVLSYESTFESTFVLSYFRSTCTFVFIITFVHRAILSYEGTTISYEGTKVHVQYLFSFVRTFVRKYFRKYESTKVLLSISKVLCTRVRKYNYVMKVRTYVRVQTGTRTVLHRSLGRLSEVRRVFFT